MVQPRRKSITAILIRKYCRRTYAEPYEWLAMWAGATDLRRDSFLVGVEVWGESGADPTTFGKVEGRRFRFRFLLACSASKGERWEEHPTSRSYPQMTVEVGGASTKPDVCLELKNTGGTVIEKLNFGDMRLHEADDDKPLTDEEFRAELLVSLEMSPVVREYYSLRLMEDGSVMILDLDKVKGFEEKIKAILRTYLKGKTVVHERHPTPSYDPNAMTPQVRRDLDALYAKIDRLQREQPARKYFKD